MIQDVVANLYGDVVLHAATEELVEITPPGVVPTGAIGAPELLSIGGSHEITSRLGLKTKTFVLLGMLALCALILAFAGEDAQAQQLPQPQDAVFGEQAAGEVSQTTVETTLIEEGPPRETLPAKASLVEPASQQAVGPVPKPQAGQPVRTAPDSVVTELSVGSTLPGAEPGPVFQPEPVSRSAIEPAEQGSVEAPVTPDLAPPVPGSANPEPVSGTEDEPGQEQPPVLPAEREEPAAGPAGPDRSTLDPAPEPVDIEGSNLLPLLAGEDAADAADAADAPAVPSWGEADDPYPLYSPETPVVGAVENIENAVANVLGTSYWYATPEGVIDAPLMGPSSGVEPGHTTAGDSGEGPKSSTTGTAGPESPLQDGAPQPVSPFTPPAGSSFSLSGGQIGAGSGVLVLLCVLASGLILPRREFKLLWAFCELPKPSSALLLPPERPG